MRNARRSILLAAAVAVLAPALLAPAPASADYGPNQCLNGFVWREAYAGDVVCVTTATRTQARADNAAAASRIDPKGAYGPKSCKSGYVWREARASDLVCVRSATRTQAKADNLAAASRRNSVLSSYGTWYTGGNVVLDAGTRHRVSVTNVNVGRVLLGLYQKSNGRLIASWTKTATPAAGRPGGVVTFRTDELVCPAGGRETAYFRVKDLTSGRSSATTKSVAVDCGTL